MILVDSSVWVDYFNGVAGPHTDYLDRALGTTLIASGDLILAEVLQGFRSDQDFHRARQVLTALTIFDLVGREVAIRSAQHYRYLRARGITVRKSVDVWIATFCIGNGMPLLFSDRDFSPFVEHLGLQPAITPVG